ncbi:MAG: response regulator [Proteobacteria bacterium]|nr:response regulator [Pseudomonadota bacterium]MBU4469459.1 response regulator [Pseudomonadota bacterium]MCG2752360.1 response regulator [Desulfobacteraceae bacterium]
MSAITIFSGAYCRKEQIIQNIVRETDFRLITDGDIINKTAELSGMAFKKIERVFSDKTSVFNKFTHEKERSLAYLKLAVANLLKDDNMVIEGFAGLLIPKAVHHVLKTCLIADMKNRLPLAMKTENLTEKEAQERLHEKNQLQALWVNTLFKLKDPWDTSLYDMVIPTDKFSDNEITDQILKNLKSEIIQPTKTSLKAAEDFLLCARIEVALAKEGHSVDVEARDGSVTLTINFNVLMLKRLEEDLKTIVSAIDGVKSVETRIGKGFYQTDIYRKYDFEVPSKVLLVDDEREFVQTLSERLIMRDMGSAVAYDGESALDMVKEDEPEVMILDLKMPGIDGIEVLKKVKDSHPDIEVIILTGHGTEDDRIQCMRLGAFAYLQKPIDIELLSETLKKANEKIKQKKGEKQP